MSADQLRRVLAEHSFDVETDRPDRLDEVHERIVGARRRRARRATVLTGAALAVVVLLVLASLVGGGRSSRPAPVIGPTPTEGPTAIPTEGPTADGPSTSRLRGAPETVEPVIGPRGLRGEELLGQMTTADSPPRVSELRTVVSVATYDFRWESYCAGAPEAWFLLSIGDGGGSYGRCDGDRPRTFPPPPRSAGLPLRQPLDVARDVEARMLLTSRNPWPFLNQSCTSSPELAVCDRIERSRLTDRGSADFGFAVYEDRTPAVASFLGHGVSALVGTVDGPYVFSHGVAAASGSNALDVDLRASPRRRVVEVVTGVDAFERCFQRTRGTSDVRFCRRTGLALWVDGTRVAGDTGHSSGFGSSASLRPGRHTLHLEIPPDYPGPLDFGVLVFEERE